MSNGTMVRAAGEEKFGGNWTRQLTSHQRLTGAGLHLSFGPAYGVTVCLFLLCRA